MTYFDPNTVPGAADSKLNKTDIILAYRTRRGKSVPSWSLLGRIKDRNERIIVMCDK